MKAIVERFTARHQAESWKLKMVMAELREHRSPSSTSEGHGSVSKVKSNKPSKVKCYGSSRFCPVFCREQ